MAPIYESDVAKERWEKAEWSHYELWERIELRLRRNKRLWIAATVIVFLLLSAVPTWVDQVPRWSSLAATRRLAQEITRMKREAAIDHSPYRIRFLGDGSVIYIVERVDQCEAPVGTRIRTGAMVAQSQVSHYRLLSSQMGKVLSIPGLLEEFCYDPLKGSYPATQGESTSGFAVIPLKDFEERRLDRMSILLLNGPSADASFE